MCPCCELFAVFRARQAHERPSSQRSISISSILNCADDGKDGDSDRSALCNIDTSFVNNKTTLSCDNKTMIDYSDPCSMGQLACNVGGFNRAESDVESVSVFSGYSRRSMGTMGTYDDGENTDPVDILDQRVARFQSKGWLSQQEYRQYSALLSTATDRNSITPAMDMLLKNLERELDILEEKNNGGIVGSMLRHKNRFSTATPVSSLGGGPPKSPFGLLRNVGAKSPSLLAASKKGDNQKDGPSIVDPKVLSKEFSDTRLSELFVETCFFGRLGFVQPPCCLQCVFKESMKGNAPNTDCTRWVIWRKDAKHVLHPNTLSQNAVAVRCNAARLLASGKFVEGCKWDKTSKVLCQPKSVKRFQQSAHV